MFKLSQTLSILAIVAAVGAQAFAAEIDSKDETTKDAVGKAIDDQTRKELSGQKQTTIQDALNKSRAKTSAKSTEKVAGFAPADLKNSPILLPGEGKGLIDEAATWGRLLQKPEILNNLVRPVVKRLEADFAKDSAKFTHVEVASVYEFLELVSKFDKGVVSEVSVDNAVETIEAYDGITEQLNQIRSSIDNNDSLSSSEKNLALKNFDGVMKEASIYRDSHPNATFIECMREGFVAFAKTKIGEAQARKVEKQLEENNCLLNKAA